MGFDLPRSLSWNGIWGVHKLTIWTETVLYVRIGAIEAIYICSNPESSAITQKVSFMLRYCFFHGHGGRLVEHLRVSAHPQLPCLCWPLFALVLSCCISS